MDLDGVTVAGIDALVDQVNRVNADVPDADVKRELESMKVMLADMRVALVELENVEEKYQRGDVPADTYFDRRKKLVRDFFAARDRIPDAIVPNVAMLASSPEEKGQLMKFRGFLKDNREFIAMGTDFILTVAKAFVIH